MPRSPLSTQPVSCMPKTRSILAFGMFSPTREMVGSGPPGLTPTGKYDSNTLQFFIPNLSAAYRVSGSSLVDVVGISVWGNGAGTNYRNFDRRPRLREWRIGDVLRRPRRRRPAADVSDAVARQADHARPRRRHRPDVRPSAVPRQGPDAVRAGDEQHRCGMGLRHQRRPRLEHRAASALWRRDRITHLHGLVREICRPARRSWRLRYAGLWPGGHRL